MISFFHKSRIYSWIISAHWLVRYGFSLTLVGLLPATWYFLVYQRLEMLQMSYSTQCEQLAKQVASIPSIKRKIKRLEKQNENIQKKYNVIGAKLKTIGATRLLQLIRAVQEQGMKIETAVDENRIPNGRARGSTVTFFGTLEQVHCFFTKILRDTWCICLHVVLIKRENELFECTHFVSPCCLDSADKKALQLKKAEGLGG